MPWAKSIGSTWGESSRILLGEPTLKPRKHPGQMGCVGRSLNGGCVVPKFLGLGQWAVFPAETLARHVSTFYRPLLRQLAMWILAGELTRGSVPK